jgi:Mg-chelatase subunit ChlD
MLLSSLGFEPASSSSLSSRLNSLSPSGGTALRDAVKSGLGMILKLNETLSSLGQADQFCFVHIVITDGDDTSSSTSLEELALIFYSLNQVVPLDRCSTAFVGVELNRTAAEQLLVLKMFGGDSCNAYQVSNVDIGEIFNRISVDVGLVRQVNVVGVRDGNRTAMMVQQRTAPVLTLRRKRFAVLLNLDFSGSMAGYRWNTLRNSAAMFVRSLQEGDIVSCLLFNDRVSLLNSIPISAPKPSTNQNTRAIQNTNPNRPGANQNISRPVANPNPTQPVEKKKKKKCTVF